MYVTVQARNCVCTLRQNQDFASFCIQPVPCLVNSRKEVFSKGGYLPRNMENGSPVNIAKVHVLDTVSLNFAQSSLMSLIIISKKQANKMHFSGSNGSCNFPDTIYALMHLQKPSSDSDRRQALAFHNEVAADEYLFFPLVTILSALIGCLGMHLETRHRAVTLWCSEMGVGAIKTISFLNLSGSGEKAEDY